MMRVSLHEGELYRAVLALPPDTPESEFAPALSVYGFADVQVVGYKKAAGGWELRGRWAGPSVVVELPEVVLSLGPASTKAKPRQEAKEPRKQGVSRKGTLDPAESPNLARRPVRSRARREGPLGDPDPSLPRAAPPISQVQVNELFKVAWANKRPGQTLTPRVMQALLSVAEHETSNARGWKDPMRASYNFCACQCNHTQDDKGQCKAGCLPYGDSRPTPQGQVAYKACFRTYPNDLAGLEGLISAVYTGKVTSADLDSGDLDRLAWGMKRNFYFGGICTKRGPSSLPPCSVFSDKMAAAQYANALEIAAAKIAKRGGTGLVCTRSGKLGEVPSTDANGNPVYRGTRLKGGGAVHLATAGLLLTAGVMLASALDLEIL